MHATWQVTCARVFRFSQQQLFDVVAEVESYKEFVPWCQRSVIIDQTDPNNLYAELEVGFRMFVERCALQATELILCSCLLALLWLRCIS